MNEIEFNGEMYLDDRMFVLYVCKCTVDITDNVVTTTIYHDGAPENYVWCLVTLKNVPKYIAVKVDLFDSEDEAIAYLQNVEPTVPLISLQGRAPHEPLPYAQFVKWKERNKLKEYDYKKMYMPGGTNQQEIIIQPLAVKFPSISTETSFTCPNCQKASNLTMWKSINVTLNPELKKRLLNRSLLTFYCPFCAFRQAVSYPIMYHDHNARFMTWEAPNNEQGKWHADRLELYRFAKYLSGYCLRSVPTVDRLLEKIIIFDNKLDDRALELLKGFTWSIRLKDQGYQNDCFHISSINLDGEYPVIEMSVLAPSGDKYILAISGRGGYPRALEMLHGEFKVSVQEETNWRTIDHTYKEFAEKGKG